METYRVTRSYLKVEQSQAWVGAMAAVPQPSKPSHSGPILQLPRQFLHPRPGVIASRTRRHTQQYQPELHAD